jgi:hypothetical protein
MTCVTIDSHKTGNWEVSRFAHNSETSMTNKKHHGKTLSIFTETFILTWLQSKWERRQLNECLLNVPNTLCFVPALIVWSRIAFLGSETWAHRTWGQSLSDISFITVSLTWWTHPPCQPRNGAELQLGHSGHCNVQCFGASLTNQLLWTG